jgi:ATP-dependent RNA helicase HrpB
MESLAIDRVIPEFIKKLSESRAVVLTAPPGAGKTTRVPPAIHQAGLAKHGQIVMLQPRRMAARAAAARMAAEYNQPVGGTVGYKIRFDKKISSETSILVVTEGILTRRFLSDPFLEGVSCLILDEFHERSIHSDLALAFVRELMQVRDDLYCIVMSATLQTKPLAKFLGDCPVISVQTRKFDLSVEHIPQTDDRPLHVRTAAGVAQLLGRPDDDQGDILVFLPGLAEIKRTQQLLSERDLSKEVEIVPLYGALTAREQDRVLLESKKRRIVLATNIAETSLTVPGVTTVVDSGLCKQMRHDPKSGIDRLELVSISQSSAEQRAGRAGRTGPGRALRLWTAHEHQGMQPADQPEIKRIDLARTLLEVLVFQPADPGQFNFFEAPAAQVLQGALSLLRMLGIVDPDGFELSELGRRLVKLPVHPRVGVILERAGRLGYPRQGALLGALLSERDIKLRQTKAQSTYSDLLDGMDLFEELAANNFSKQAAGRLEIDFSAARMVRQVRDQLLRLIDSKNKNPKPADSQTLLALILAGFPDRVCRRRKPSGREALMVGGRGVRLAEDSGVDKADLFVALEADAGKRGMHSTALVRRASSITEEMLAELFPELIKAEQAAIFDPDKRAVIGVSRRYFMDLLIDERSGVKVAADVVALTLAMQAAKHFDEIFKPDKKALQLRARIMLAARAMPEIDWLDVSQAGIQTWLTDLCLGKSRFSELARLAWAKEFEARLGYKNKALLDKELPARIKLSSGKSFRLDYEPASPPEGMPVLAVKIQQLFGVKDTPKIARGRVAVVLHLLAPNGRPAQITSDLKNFWKETYPQVRKELRARYPKHAWPEKPA